MNRSYILITPCRDEAEYCTRTLDSVLGQSVPPARWIIVDDGSTDETPRILAEYARAHPCITVVTRKDRGGRAVGPGVIDAFYAGYEAAQPITERYLCKLDLDLDLPEVYFERLMERMERDPRIGTCSGKPYYLEPGTNRLISEKCGDETSVGMTKFYRTECFEEIGGFVREVMWDGIDCHRCRMFGWKAVSWDDPEIRFTHLRPMGSSQQSIWTGRLRHGYGQYFMGTSLPFMTASALYRMTRPPLLVGGLAMWWGFVRSMLRGKPRYEDAAFRAFLRCYQWDALLRGKARAIESIDREGDARWSNGRPCEVAAATPSERTPQPMLRRA
jgi:poly-beta-1,6-N-acetyl-D-glucosamine synthase